MGSPPQTPPLLTGEVTLCFGALQGYPEAPRLWEHYADKIIRTLALKSTIHELCHYSGFVQDKRVLICRQVDNFAVAVSAECIANIIFDHIDDLLPSPLTKMGLITLFNDVDVLQTRDYIKILVEAYITRMSERHLVTWMDVRGNSVKMTPLPNKATFSRPSSLVLATVTRRSKRSLPPKWASNKKLLESIRNDERHIVAVSDKGLGPVWVETA